MADYRILSPRFWTNENFRKIENPDYKIILIYLLTGLHACSYTQVGLYKIRRGEINLHTSVDMKTIEDAIKYFNKDKYFFEYDAENHVVFIKAFMKWNCRQYLNTPKKLAAAIKKDMENVTLAKHPNFWKEFAKINEKRILEMREKLSEKDRNFDNISETFEKILSLL